MRITISFHDEKDKDIIEYIQGHNRTYRIREAIRKAIQFDEWMEKVLAKGITEEPKNSTVKIKEEPTIETSKEVPQLSEEEINKKLNEQF